MPIARDTGGQCHDYHGTANRPARSGYNIMLLY